MARMKLISLPFSARRRLQLVVELSPREALPVAEWPRIDVESMRRRQQKIFCIGFPKTGTTSIEAVLKRLGASMGNQPVGEVLAEDWANGRTDRILRFCHTADAFQDLPFSMPGLYEHLDKAFPNSKFVLSVRNSDQQWYESLVRFHTGLFSDNGSPPTADMLARAMYRYKGFVLDTRKLFWGYPEVGLYDAEAYKSMYCRHKRDAESYFQGREADFLVLNVGEERSLQTLGRFLGVDIPNGEEFPWLNRSQPAEPTLRNGASTE